MSGIPRLSALSAIAAPSSVRPISENAVLDLLNDAVWAPNDENREPWRFVYAADPRALPDVPDSVEACLIVVAPLSPDPAKQIEDFAACCCLAENVRLLALAQGWNATRTLESWTRTSDRLSEWGIGDNERIAAVLELSPLAIEAASERQAADSIRFDLF
ncbi:hypothetical protein [Saccharibacillus sacchari]|uniref:Uncharacterized protein n=1 Tax=Saccharibacillus sacchari TaxID=456493 RepID=A0ACC6PFA4_9BACL